MGSTRSVPFWIPVCLGEMGSSIQISAGRLSGKPLTVIVSETGTWTNAASVTLRASRLPPLSARAAAIASPSISAKCATRCARWMASIWS
ncbi:hypothetical protein D3C72_2295670 [compost metagenome]